MLQMRKLIFKEVNDQVTNQTQIWLHSLHTFNCSAILPPITFIPMLTKFEGIAHSHRCLRLLKQTWWMCILLIELSEVPGLRFFLRFSPSCHNHVLSQQPGTEARSLWDDKESKKYRDRIRAIIKIIKRSIRSLWWAVSRRFTAHKPSTLSYICYNYIRDGYGLHTYCIILWDHVHHLRKESSLGMILVSV